MHFHFSFVFNWIVHFPFHLLAFLQFYHFIKLIIVCASFVYLFFILKKQREIPIYIFLIWRKFLTIWKFLLVLIITFFYLHTYPFWFLFQSFIFGAFILILEGFVFGKILKFICNIWNCLNIWRWRLTLEYYLSLFCRQIIFRHVVILDFYLFWFIIITSHRNFWFLVALIYPK